MASGRMLTPEYSQKLTQVLEEFGAVIKALVPADPSVLPRVGPTQWLVGRTCQMKIVSNDGSTLVIPLDELNKLLKGMVDDLITALGKLPETGSTA